MATPSSAWGTRMLQAVDAEEAGRDLHHPQGGRRLVDGDEVGGVGRSEEEGLPALGPGLDGRRVEAVGPAGLAEAPEVEEPGADQQRPAGPAGPRPDPRAVPGPAGASRPGGRRRGRWVGRAAPTPPGRVGPGDAPSGRRRPAAGRVEGAAPSVAPGVDDGRRSAVTAAGPERGPSLARCGVGHDGVLVDVLGRCRRCPRPGRRRRRPDGCRTGAGTPRCGGWRTG